MSEFPQGPTAESMDRAISEIERMNEWWRKLIEFGPSAPLVGLLTPEREKEQREEWDKVHGKTQSIDAQRAG